MLPSLSDDTNFVISSGLLYMLQNEKLFTGFPLEDTHNHLHNVIFVYKSIMENQNLSMDIVGLYVFSLSLTGKVIVWLSELL